jgi:hypothetical protein
MDVRASYGSGTSLDLISGAGLRPNPDRDQDGHRIFFVLAYREECLHPVLNITILFSIGSHATEQNFMGQRALGRPATGSEFRVASVLHALRVMGR